MEVRIGDQTLPVACSSWSFGILPFDKSARIIRALGFDRIDIGFAHIHIDPSLSCVQQGRQIRRKLKSEGLILTDLFPAFPYETNDLDDCHRRLNREYFEWVVCLAGETNSPGITLKPGIRQHVNENEGWTVCVDVLGDFLTLSQKAGL